VKQLSPVLYWLNQQHDAIALIQAYAFLLHRPIWIAKTFHFADLRFYLPTHIDLMEIRMALDVKGNDESVI
jgi:hypothetical protein